MGEGRKQLNTHYHPLVTEVSTDVEVGNGEVEVVGWLAGIITAQQGWKFRLPTYPESNITLAGMEVGMRCLIIA